MKKQLGIVGAVLLGLIILSLLATIVTRAQETGASATVVVDEAAREYRVRFTGLVDFGGEQPMRFRFDLSDRRCKDPARLTAGGTHIDRLIYDRQAAEGGGTLERKEAVGPQCPFHVKHTVTVRLWSPSDELLAQASAPFCLGGCAEPTEPTATRWPTRRPATGIPVTDTPIPPPTAVVKPLPTQLSDAKISVAAPQRTRISRNRTSNSQPGCIPAHAAAPVRLCPTGSGSGWWVYYFGRGRSMSGPHLAYPRTLVAQKTGSGLVLQTVHPLTGAPVAAWWDAELRVLWLHTRYADGKLYVMAINEIGSVRHVTW